MEASFLSSTKALESTVHGIQIKLGLALEEDMDDNKSVENGSSSGKQDFMRPSAKDVPKFSGKNIEEWLLKITKFFRHYHIKDDKRLFLATQSMEGDALDWLV